MPGRSDTPGAEAPRSGRAGWLSTLRFLLLLALAAWVLRSLLVAPFSIPSASMLPTMLPGDYLFVAKWPYGYSRFSFPGQLPAFPGRLLGRLPERGDVVIFKRPGSGEDFVKRVIGLPGDRVALAGGQVILNGRPVARRGIGEVALKRTANTDCPVDGQPTCRYPAVVEMLPDGRRYLTFDQLADGPADDFAAVTVPPGHLFLLGDNRDDSADSRFPLAEGGVGMVPIDHLVGRAAFAFWSTDGSAELARPWTWFSALRTERLGQGYQP